MEHSTELAIKLGKYTVCPALGRVSSPDGSAHLEPKIMDLLVFLAERSGDLVTRTQIIERVWHGAEVSDDVISRAIYQIRKTLVDPPGKNAIIETVPKRGYLFKLRIAADPASPGRSTTRLAILPFANLSPDPANAFFADGLHEEILGALTQECGAVEVISRTTMLRFRRKAPGSVRELARELNATHVVEGSVRRAGQDVRLTVQLIDARTDRHVWSHNYDRKLGHVTTLQSEVATELAAHLSARLTRGPLTLKAPTHDSEAYDFYLRARLARQHLNPAVTRERFRAAEELLCAALARDPDFTLAYTERIRVRAWMLAWNYETEAVFRAAIHQDLESLRRLLPDSEPLRMAMEGLVCCEVDYQPDAALAHYSGARSAGYAESTFLQSLARLYLRLNRVDDALRAIQHAAALEPSNVVLLSVGVLLHMAARRPVEALRLSERATAVGAMALHGLYAQFAYTGRTQALQAFLDGDAGVLDPDYRTHLSFRVMLLCGRFAAAMRVLAASPRTTLRVCLSYVGVMLAGVGVRPIAELRGWAAKLLGLDDSAAAEGRAVLEFASHMEWSATNRWFLQLLIAQGHVFRGESVEAIVAARAALALAPPAHDAVAHVEAAFVAAAVLAWSGAGDEAMTILEGLAVTMPALGPAFIVCDPICKARLANNPRYRRLTGKLEAEMAAHSRRIDDALGAHPH